ncbi:MAG: HDIG domain-containing protein [Candidatus Bathyarchaeota archaeon]|jgi:7,8-dihydroneopterin 2',3'-cyclic phosphate phosphodiesterase
MLHPKLKKLASQIKNQKLREKVINIMEDPTLRIDGEVFSGLPFDTSPAGLSHHHCYSGGYLEHVESTAILAKALCRSVERVYKGRVNRDLVIAGVLLHDLFKPNTYALNRNKNYIQSPLAEYLDHVSLAVSELIRRDFPLKLIHIVSAHHGDYGSIRPHTIEALICHLADFIDSRMNSKILNAATYIARKANAPELQRLTLAEALKIVYSKTDRGWEGVTGIIKEIIKERERDKT